MCRSLSESPSNHVSRECLTSFHSTIWHFGSQAAYTLGILFQTTGVLVEAKQTFALALGVYEAQLGPDHESSVDIRTALASLPAH